MKENSLPGDPQCWPCPGRIRPLSLIWATIPSARILDTSAIASRRIVSTPLPGVVSCASITKCSMVLSTRDLTSAWIASRSARCVARFVKEPASGGLLYEPRVHVFVAHNVVRRFHLRCRAARDQGRDGGRERQKPKRAAKPHRTELLQGYEPPNRHSASGARSVLAGETWRNAIRYGVLGVHTLRSGTGLVWPAGHN